MFRRLSVNSVRMLTNKNNKPIRLSVDTEGIALMTMQRAPANLMDMEFFEVFIESLNEISEKKYKGMILTSSLPTIFTGGLDLKMLYNPDVERLKQFWRLFGNVMLKLSNTEFPTAVANNGHTAAAVCILSSLVEYRVMVSGKGTIGVNDTLVGIAPSVSVIEPLRYLLGSRRAELALTTSEMFTAEAALKIGLVDEVATNKEEAVDKCKQFIRRCNQIPALTRALTKQSAREPTIKWLKENTTLHVTEGLKTVTNPQTQKIFETYLHKLKQKKSS